MWKDFFYFSRRERQGILLLIVFIGGIFAGKFIFSSSKPQPAEELEFTKEELNSKELSSGSPEQAYAPLYQSQSPRAYKKYNNPSRPEEKKTFYARRNDSIEHSPSTVYPKAEKFSEGTVIELNTADSLDLMKIPGIGSSFAKRIIAYRNLLGGYHRVEQLQEVYGMYEELYEKITPYLNIDSKMIAPLPLNTASLDKLKAHPYINFYQAKAIIEMRKKKGKLAGTEELKLLEEFTDEDWIRITPYLAY
jgi:competence ComEA-like helix-hairpin-helix protein